MTGRAGHAAPPGLNRHGSGKYAFPASPAWPEGLTVQIYDDGRINIGAWRAVP